MQNPEEDTQWNDILREKGIIPPKKELEVTHDQLEYMIDQVIEEKAGRGGDRLEEKTLDEIDLLLEEDAMLDEEEKVIQEFREKRMKEYLEAAAKDVFGELYPISKPDFISQVTEASKNYPVIVFLYKSSLQASQLMHNTLQIVASRHKSSKFTAIESTQCIPNYPDRNVPTLLLYREGELVHQIVGLDTLGGMRMSLKSLENSLVKWKMIETKPFNDNDDDGNDDNDDDDDQSRFHSRKKAIIY